MWPTKVVMTGVYVHCFVQCFVIWPWLPNPLSILFSVRDCESKINAIEKMHVYNNDGWEMMMKGRYHESVHFFAPLSFSHADASAVLTSPFLKLFP